MTVANKDIKSEKEEISQPNRSLSLKDDVEKDIQEGE